jgi:hypothetical protein
MLDFACISPGRTTKIFITLAVLAIISACGADGPREEFREELSESVDRLVKKMKRLRPGMEIVKGDMHVNGRTSETSIKIPRAVAVASAVEDVAQYFQRVSIALLTEDMAGYDAWAERMKSDIENHRSRLNDVTAIVTERIGDNIEDYVTDRDSDDYYGNTGIDYMFRGAMDVETAIGLTEEGQVYFRPSGSNTGYFPDKLLEFDIDAWLTQIKAQSIAMQGLSEDGSEG